MNTALVLTEDEYFSAWLLAVEAVHRGLYQYANGEECPDPLEVAITTEPARSIGMGVMEALGFQLDEDGLRSMASEAEAIMRGRSAHGERVEGPDTEDNR